MTKEEVRIILKYHFPKCAINKLKEFQEGFNNIAYDVSISNPKKLLVVKILKCRFHKNLKEQAEKEQAIYKIIHKKYPRFQLPKMIIFDSSKKVIGKPYLINKKISGVSLNEAFDKIKNKEEVFEQLGRLRAKLHSIKFKNFGHFDKKGKLKKLNSSLMKRQTQRIEKMFKDIEDKKSAPKKFIKTHYNFWIRIKDRLNENPSPSLCQGDPSYTNILVDKKNGKYYVKAFIDFEFAKVGDPMSDICRSKPYLVYLIKGYAKYAKLPNDWEFRILFYQWENNLGVLGKLKDTNWRGLSKKENNQRRKLVKEQNIKQANTIMELILK